MIKLREQQFVATTSGKRIFETQQEFDLFHINEPKYIHFALIGLDRQDAKNLLDFISAQGYISREFHGPIHEMIKVLREFVGKE